MCAGGRIGDSNGGRVMTAEVDTSGWLMAADVCGLAFLWQAGFSHVYCHLYYTLEMEEGGDLSGSSLFPSDCHLVEH